MANKLKFAALFNKSKEFVDFTEELKRSVKEEKQKI